MGTSKDEWFFCLGRKEWGPISLGADERHPSTFQDLPGDTQEAKPARSNPCSMKPHSVTMFSLLLQCHNGTLDPWSPTVSHHGLHDSMGPCNATMVSMDPRWPQDHNSPVAARGPVMQRWPLGSTKPCCFTPAPWDQGAQQCHNDVLGAKSVHSVTIVPWLHRVPDSVTMITSFHKAPKCPNGLHREESTVAQCFRG